MRTAIALTAAVLLLLQWALWLGDRSWSGVWQREAELERLAERQARLAERNQRLRAELMDLRSGDEALEERARQELGMVKSDEIFIRIVRPRSPDGEEGEGASAASGGNPAEGGAGPR
jgi:cell division protein FtsB